MNAENLSLRLQTVAQYIQGETLADIGSDHAYLPCFAIGNKLVEKAIAGEVVHGPFQSARQQVEQQKLTCKIDVRLGDGLQVIELADEVDCITICGMGGSLIAQILEQGKERLSGKERLILQPNIASEFVRRWLQTNNWAIIAEDIILEDGKVYEVIVSEKSEQEVALSDLEIFCGPKLLESPTPVFKMKWKSELAHLKQILKQMSTSQANLRNEERKHELTQKITLIETIDLTHNCL